LGSRRLKRDRFLSKDYRPEVYTTQGIDWVEDNGMKSVIARHFPALGPAMEGVDTAFNVWKGKGQAK
jgi:hypothetical protein